jgi:hypothetical protein
MVRLHRCLSYSGIHNNRNPDTAVNIFATGKQIPKSEVLAQLDFSMAMSFFTAMMRPIDVLLSLGAIFAAFWFSFKHLKPPQP